MVPTVLTGLVEPNLEKMSFEIFDSVVPVPRTIDAGNRVVHAEAAAPTRLSNVHMVG